MYDPQIDELKITNVHFKIQKSSCHFLHLKCLATPPREASQFWVPECIPSSDDVCSPESLEWLSLPWSNQQANLKYTSNYHHSWFCSSSHDATTSSTSFQNGQVWLQINFWGNPILLDSWPDNITKAEPPISHPIHVPLLKVLLTLAFSLLMLL